MRISVIGAATIALLSTTALVGAQQMQEPRGQPSAKEQGAAPSGKMVQDNKSGGEKGSVSGKSAQGGADMKEKAGDTKSKAAESSKDKAGDTKSKAAETKEKAGDTKSKAAESSKDKAGDTKSKAAETKDKAGDTKSKAAEGSKDKAGDTKSKAAETKDKAGKDRDQAQRDKDRDQARDKDRDQAQRDKDGKDAQRDQARGKDDGRDGDRVTLNQNQRTEVREKLSRHREARVTNVNFSIQVGTRVPRDFSLHVIPADIVTIVPAYRGYRYFIVEERVVIVHPTRYEIVEVIEVDGPRRGGTTTASFDLSRAQIALILDSIPHDRRADVSVDLALGAEVPSSVELYTFPVEIVREVPAIREYRYVATQRRVLIVDPSGRDVVHVIDR